MRELTLGSLFDGSGGFPLGAVLHGIKPVWASEIEPFPVRVTTKRLPHMKHYGDISRMDGARIEPVDITSFGSPCTDLSVAGRRAGLGGTQSSLFYEAIRVIREMRSATNGRSPRFIVWENVPGAFSSHGGEDFRAVLEAAARVAQPEAEVPAPEKGSWPYADVLLGDGWSMAYRTLDAQYFGVAQRRRRVYLVADFGSERAGEVLFEREGVPRNFAPRFASREGTAGDPAHGAGTAVAFEPGAASRLGGHCWDNYSGTLRADMGDNQLAVAMEDLPRTYGVCSKDSGAMLSANPLVGFYEADTSRALDRNGGNPACNQGGVAVCVRDSRACYSMTTGSFAEIHEEKASTLMARDYKDPQLVARPRYVARRLTPLECGRLQGFPDWWCDGLETPEPAEDEIDRWAEVFETHRRIMGNSDKPRSRAQIAKWLRDPYSDSAAYKMWGNGVALPCVCFVMAGIMELVKSEET